MEDRNGIIEHYFNNGYKQKEIISCLLFIHGHKLSLRQLKRILAQRGLSRRKRSSNLTIVLNHIEQELQCSGRDLGYRNMWQRLVVEQGLSVHKETVRHALRVLDPEGVDMRLRHRLRRRQYKGRGPNFLWHIDGYDKLKPYGFCIHGGIDGYSRRILWLEVGVSNNDPAFIAKYFVDCVMEVGGTARIVRADNGTENTYVASIQRFLRNNSNDSFACDKSFMYGRSVSNQRIEAWWSQLRRGCTDWWMQHFKELRENGLYCDSNPVQVDCLRFSYMDLIRDDLHRFANLWNNHLIRPSSNGESPSGRPDLLYFLPEISATQNFLVAVDKDDVTLCEQLLCDRSCSRVNCSQEFLELAQLITEEENLVMPTTPLEARSLYVSLINHIDNL